MVFCDDGVEESANEVDKGETSSTYHFHRYKKKMKFEMKRETNTITNRGKHMSYGVGSYIYMLVFNVVVITTSLFPFFVFGQLYPLPLVRLLCSSLKFTDSY